VDKTKSLTTEGVTFGRERGVAIGSDLTLMCGS
jgi:hypothetical protein